MSGERIKAGEAYVLVTCDNNNLKNGLQEVVRSVDEAAREISAKEKELSPTVKIDPEPVKKAIDEALEKARDAANAGSNLWGRFVITAGDAAKAVGNALKYVSSALGETGDAFEKASKRTGVASATLSEYAHAAKTSGADFGAVENAFKRMAKTLAAAEQGSGEASAVGRWTPIRASRAISLSYPLPLVACVGGPPVAV